MRSRTSASLCLLALLIGISGCGSESNPARTWTAPPSISISPIYATTGSADLVLTVIGSGFVGEIHDQSIVVWSVNGNDTSLATTFLSSTQLTAVIPAALLANPVTAKVLVETGDPTGSGPFAKSNSVEFGVRTTSPALSVSSISPMSTVAGSPDLTLTVMGSNFPDGKHNKSFVVCFVNNSGTYLSTTFVDSTQLIAVIPANLLGNPTTAQVWVETGDPFGSGPFSKSNPINFSVTSP